MQFSGLKKATFSLERLMDFLQISVKNKKNKKEGEKSPSIHNSINTNPEKKINPNTWIKTQESTTGTNNINQGFYEHQHHKKKQKNIRVSGFWLTYRFNLNLFIYSSIN